MSKDKEEKTDSSSSSDEDMDEEVDSANAAKIAQLKADLVQNPYDYDKYLALIQVLKENGELDDLRSIRSKFAQAYPLAPDIWLAWLSDEQKLAMSNEEKEKVGELFEKAVTDYVSVDIWTEYCQFILWKMADGGPEAIRQVLERAVVAAGLHVAKGSLIWDAYREFENALLAGDPGNADQKSRVDKIFRRQLAVPSLNMESTMQEYLGFLQECGLGDLDPNVERVYKSARELLKERQIFEDQLASDPSLKVYESYIQLELRHANPIRVKCIYERRATDHCLVEAVWSEYADYLGTQLKDLTEAKSVLARAVRNCTWSGRLWVKMVRICERLGESKIEVCKQLEAGLVSLSEPSHIRDLWLAYIDFCRRRLVSDDEDQVRDKDKEDLRTLFKRALDHLAALGGDVECKMARYWASIEADRFRDMERARQIWSEILAGPAGDKSSFWIEYIFLEKMFGDSKHLKRLFPRALAKPTLDDFMVIGEMWIQFEREEGTLDSFEDAEKKVFDRMNSDLDAAQKVKDQAKEQPVRKRKFERKDQNVEAEPVRKKALQSKEPSPSTSKANDAKIMPPPGFKPSSDSKIMPPPGFKPSSDSSCENRRVFLSNISYDVTEDELRTFLSKSGVVLQVSMATGETNRGRGFASAEFETVQAVQHALKRDHEPLKGRPVFISEFKPDKDSRPHQFKYSTEMEKRKLFVRGLPLEATKETLAKLFSPYGSLEDVRLVTFRNGHSKGIAYVDFKNSSDASKALIHLDNFDLNGKKISVAISNPPPRKSEAATSKPSAPDLSQSLGGARVGRAPGARAQVSFVPRALQTAKSTTNGSSSNKMSNADFRSMMLSKNGKN